MPSLAFIAPVSQQAKAPKGSLGDGTNTILVYPHIIFNNLNAISMHEQTFETEIQLELTWMDSSVTERLNSKETWHPEVGLPHLWHPGLRLNNCAEIKDIEYWFRLVDREAGLVAFVVRMVGVFREVVQQYGVRGLFQGILPRMGLSIWQTLFMVSGATFIKDKLG